ncbi:DUF3043 domain-containing protein [Leucobacter weissii]|uniref:DUF3043 domain-containing protein n=1 Tax=Leucobacter weissii TaxID=1983706 RepID=A0A939S6N1_9MICO|nr:DUF3043 domain-containing protein [Leucobacter weissii]
MAKDRAAEPAEQDEPSNGPVGKGRPTPSRKEAQAAKAQPLVGGNLDRSAKKAQRVKMAETRERARVGMMQGDERYLTARDKGPQRRYIRDYVDARFSVGEFLIPVMLVVLLMTFLPAQWQIASMLAIWLYLGISIIDAIFLGLRLRKKLSDKFGADKVQSGSRWYAAMRAFQFRMLRVPKPQVKRLQFPE